MLGRFKYLLALCVILQVLPCRQAAAVDPFFQEIEGQTVMDDELRDIVEFLRLQMKCGWPPAGIPPLAPYHLESKEFQFNTWDTRGSVNDFTITGLNEFDIKELNWNNVQFKLKFDINFPNLLVHSNYKMDAFMPLFGSKIHMFGDGLLRLDLENLRIHGSFHLRPTTKGKLRIWAFKVKVELDDVNSRTTGIMNSAIYTKLFNSWIEEMVHLIIDESSEEVSAAVENLVVPPLNEVLKNFTPIELIALILGFVSEGIPNEALC